MTRTLWRLDGDQPGTQIDSDKLRAGLARHLQHADLVMIAVQIAGRQQQYLALAGCGCCVPGPCHPGCYATLLRRLLHAVAPQLTVSPVAHGLRPRPYTQIIAAWPGSDATSLDTALLAPWPEARLIVHWATTRQAATRVAALLAVAGDAADPADALQGAGWRTRALPRLLLPLGQRWLPHVHRSGLPFPHRTPLAPMLLRSAPTLPPPAPDTVMHQTPETACHA